MKYLRNELRRVSRTAWLLVGLYTFSLAVVYGHSLPAALHTPWWFTLCTRLTGYNSIYSANVQIAIIFGLMLWGPIVLMGYIAEQIPNGRLFLVANVLGSITAILLSVGLSGWYPVQHSLPLTTMVGIIAANYAAAFWVSRHERQGYRARANNNK